MKEVPPTVVTYGLGGHEENRLLLENDIVTQTPLHDGKGNLIFPTQLITSQDVKKRTFVPLNAVPLFNDNLLLIHFIG